MRTRTIEERVEILASMSEVLIECVGDLARIIVRETGNTEAVEMVTAKLSAFNFIDEFRNYLDEGGDGD